jgi:hypothetical protein
LGYFNVSKHVNSTKEVKIIPRYTLHCQRGGLFVENFEVKEVMWDCGGCVEIRDKGLWGVIRKETFVVGEKRIVKVNYKL